MKADTYQLMRKIEDGHWWFVARRKIIEDQLRSLAIPEHAGILEIGCGTGGNIALLNCFGDVTCVELDEAAAKLARERNISPVILGSLPDEMPHLSRQFDLVTLFDVIEHIEEDEASLRKCCTLLKPGGRLVITVPAFNFLWSQHDDENHHKRRYRRRDLVTLAQRCELSLDNISYFNFWLFPAIAAIKIMRKIIPYRRSWQDMRQPNEISNKILQAIFSSERYILSRSSLPFGVSLIAVMTKKNDTES